MTDSSRVSSMPKLRHGARDKELATLGLVSVLGTVKPKAKGDFAASPILEGVYAEDYAPMGKGNAIASGPPKKDSAIISRLEDEIGKILTRT